MDPVVLPSLYYPFEEEISAHAGAVETHTIDWLVARGLVTGPVTLDRFRASHFGRLAARTSPDADLEGLKLAADWGTWLFALDDHFDEYELGSRPAHLIRWFRRFMQIAEFPHEEVQPGEDVFCHALADVALRITARATPVQMKRFIDSARAYFSAILWEASNRVTQRIPPLMEYRRMRRLSGAVPTTFDLIDVVGGFELGADERVRPDLRALYWSAVDITCWSNDILSYAKELQRGGDFHNLPSVLQQERRCTVQEAMVIASRMHDDEVRNFLDVERQLLERGGSPELRRYAAGLRSWIQGNYRWSLETARYVTHTN